MPLRIGFLGVAHMHAWGYCQGFKGLDVVEVSGVWDGQEQQASDFAANFKVPIYDSQEKLLENCDAVVVCSENVNHFQHVMLAIEHKKHVLCEKPLVVNIEQGEQMIQAANAQGVILMTAFPCRYSPAFLRLRERIASGEIGTVLAVNATNRGSCPMGWFVDPELSGGGAMIDHVVHVADLLRTLFACEVTHVQAQIGNNMYGQEWDDTAMLTLELSNGVFATLDSSWSRHSSFKTWGDLTMSVVGEKGIIELDMFNQGFDVYRSHQTGSKSHNVSPFGSDLDAALVKDFVACVQGGREVTTTGFDGLAATRVALAGYESSKTRSVAAVS